jgi:hypothetical protein
MRAAARKRTLDAMTCADVSSLCLEAWKGTPVVAAAATVLAAAILESPSARHNVRPRAAAGLTVAAAALFVACGFLAAMTLALGAVLTLAGALAASAGALWLLRTTPDGRDDHGGGGGRGAPDAGPGASGPADSIDWDAFEADFAAYATRHALVRVR